MPVLPSSGENGDGDSQCGGDGNGDDDDLGDFSKEAQGGKERKLPGDFLRELTNKNVFFPRSVINLPSSFIVNKIHLFMCESLSQNFGDTLKELKNISWSF